MVNEKGDRNEEAGKDESNAEAIENMLADISPQKRGSETKRLSITSPASADLEKTPQKLMTDEMAEREIGKVGKEVYMTWARAAGGMWVLLLLFFVYASGECTRILSNWWLTYWSHNATPDTVSQLHYLGIYGLINVVAIVADFLRMFVVLIFGLRASTNVSPDACTLFEDNDSMIRAIFPPPLNASTD
jgi:hypothetical protein